MKGFFVVISCFASWSCTAQGQPIRMYKTFGGVVFEMDTTILSTKQTMSVLYQNPEAYREFKIAKARSDAAAVMGFAGGLMLAVPLITALSGKDPEWALVAGGAALILGSIPLHRSFRGHALNALDIYNKDLSSSRVRPELYFTAHGAGLVIKF